MVSPPYRFVSYDLDASIEVAEKLWANRGDGAASNNELAVLLGYSSANNGAFLTRLANARLFQILEGPTSALRVSPLACRILHPEYPEEAAAARIEAFENVPLFKAVLDRYHGQVLPSESGFKNALQATFGINADKAGFVATRLLDSAEQAGLFSVAGDRSKMIRPTLGKTSAVPQSLSLPLSRKKPPCPPQQRWKQPLTRRYPGRKRSSMGCWTCCPRRGTALRSSWSNGWDFLSPPCACFMRCQSKGCLRREEMNCPPGTL